MNTENKTVLVGKGPSAKNIKKSNDYNIAALNNALILCEEVDYLFINDFEVLELLEKEDWDKVKKVILPTYPHYRKKPNKNLPYISFLNQIPNQTIEYSIYRMQTCLDNDPQYPYFGPIHSVATTAIYWLGKNGCKNLDYCGIDPTGNYNQVFNIKKYKNPIIQPQSISSYVLNHNNFIKISKEFNIKLNRI